MIGENIVHQEFNRLLLTKLSHGQQGRIAEQQALKYLCEQGLTLVTRNFHCKLGEIDLIMQDTDVLVFIEVKYRKSSSYGTPVEAVSLSKQKKIVKTAQVYLQKQGLKEYNSKCRFDVVAIAGSSTNTDITWLKNAFYGV